MEKFGRPAKMREEPPKRGPHCIKMMTAVKCDKTSDSQVKLCPRIDKNDEKYGRPPKIRNVPPKKGFKMCQNGDYCKIWKYQRFV